MAGETQSNSASSSIATEWDKVLIPETREVVVFIPWTDLGPLVGAGTKHWDRLSSTPSLTSISNGATEADAQSLTQLTTASATASPNARALHIMASWVLKAQSQINWDVEIPQIAARASVQDLEALACSLLSGFSATAGTTNVKLSIQDLRTAVFKLRIGGLAAAGAARAAFFLEPYQVDNVDEELMNANGPGLATIMSRADLINWYQGGPNRGMLSAFRGGIFGDIPVLTTTNVPNMNGSTDHGGALVLEKLAIGGAFNIRKGSAWLHQLAMADQSVNFKLADSVYILSDAASTEKKDEMGVTVLSKHR